MHNVTTSRRIRTSSELMIMVPIKNEFVPVTDLVMTYASRISVVLQALAELRQLKVERGFDNPIGPIERLQTIYRVQWTVIEPFDDVTTSSRSIRRQMQGPQVVLTSHFDSSWENYFQALVTTGGPLLDLIFSHCQDYEGFSCQDGFEAFSSFIRRHQRRCDFLYATAPELTIDDVRYFTKYSSNLQGGQQGLPPSVSNVDSEAFVEIARQRVTVHDERTRSSLRAIHGLHDIRQRLFLDTGGLPANNSVKAARTDRKLYEDAVASTLVLEPELYRLASALDALEKPTGGMPPVSPAPELEKARRWIRSLVGALKPKPASQTPWTDAETAPKPPLPGELTANDAEALLADVQGNILNSFPPATHAKLVLLRCRDRAGLQRVLTWAKLKFTSESEGRKPTTLVRINLGLSHHGLKLLELPQSVLEWFPREFREGMEERAGLLGDVAHNHPRHWKLPTMPSSEERLHLSTVHVALILQGDGAEITKALADLEHINSQGELLHTLDLNPSGEPERSQPIPHAGLRPKPDEQVSALDVQELGEFLLGYKNKAGVVATCTQLEHNETGWTNLFKNGSFMAMRKMRKDQTALDRYVEHVAQDIIGDHQLDDHAWKDLREDVHALIMGRRPDGGMLGSLQPARDKAANGFDYSADPTGAACPLDSHVRRSNPRANTTPRIARRGIPYQQPAAGPDEKEDGLLFMAYCASLSSQYEIVQRWVNGANSTGLLSRQNDPLCGAPLDTNTPRIVDISTTIAKKLPVTKTLLSLQPPAAPFVTLRWGLYLFMPSLTALYRLSDFVPESRTALDPDAIARGHARIAELDALPVDLRTHEWKRLLEEVPAADSPQALQARDVAAAITDAGGALKFQGVDGSGADAREVEVVVVTRVELARAVLSNSHEFSVKEYRQRLQRALSDHYLGYDLSSTDLPTGLTYAQLSATANQKFKELANIAASDAHQITARILGAPGAIELDPDGSGLDLRPRSTISVRDLALAAIGELCEKWLQMPGGDPPVDDTAPNLPPIPVDQRRRLMYAVERLLVASRYCFQAMPVPYLAQEAAKNRVAIIEDYKSYANAPQHAIAKAAITSFTVPGGGKNQTSIKPGDGPRLSSAEIERLSITVLLGAVGFAPPAVGAITRILDYWIETEQLWQIQRAWRTKQCSKTLQHAIVDALSKVPAPPTLYRTATAQARPLGGVSTVPAEALVIVNLASVYEDALRTNDPMPVAWFFGGAHGGAQGGNPQHGCPGQSAGLLAIEKIIAALLERQNIRRERRLLLSYDRKE